MDNTEHEDFIEDDFVEDTSSQACYIFRSGCRHSEGSRERPNKKRKLNDIEPNQSFHLSKEYDSENLSQRRNELFSTFWQHGQEFLRRSVNENSLNLLANFVRNASTTLAPDRLPTALLLTGLDAGNHEAVLRELTIELGDLESVSFVNIQARHCSNLQMALKNIIKLAIVQASGLDAYNSFLATHKKLLPLSFDLELLERFVQHNSVFQVVVALSDVEAFDSHVTNELISTLHMWQDRIPFTLILGVTSTQQLFEQRLSKSCLKLVNSLAFDFQPSRDLNSETIRRFQTINEDWSSLFFGSSVIAALNDIAQNQANSLQSLAETLHLLYMSHFVANPLSVLSAEIPTKLGASDIHKLAEAVRRTTSFKAYCRDLLEQKDKNVTSRVRSLFADDNGLLSEVTGQISQGQSAYHDTVTTIHALANLHCALADEYPKIQRPKLEIEAQLYLDIGDLNDCIMFSEVEAALRSLPTTKVIGVFRKMPSSLLVKDIQKILMTVDNEGVTPGALNQEEAIRNHGTDPFTSAPTTPGKRGKGSTARPSSTKFSSTIARANTSVEDILIELKEKLQHASLDVSTLLSHEAYILSTRTIRFKPSIDSQPRAAIERALVRPGDYLGCDCCTDNLATADPPNSQQSVDHNQLRQFNGNRPPPASILFSLLQEAPSIINVRDLFDAFRSRLESDTANPQTLKDVGEEETLASTMGQFYRALAELKMIGLVKASTGVQIKKRSAGKNTKSASQDIDFVAKTSWAGL